MSAGGYPYCFFPGSFPVSRFAMGALVRGADLQLSAQHSGVARKNGRDYRVAREVPREASKTGVALLNTVPVFAQSFYAPTSLLRGRRRIPVRRALAEVLLGDAPVPQHLRRRPARDHAPELEDDQPVALSHHGARVV